MVQNFLSFVIVKHAIFFLITINICKKLDYNHDYPKKMVIDYRTSVFRIEIIQNSVFITTFIRLREHFKRIPGDVKISLGDRKFLFIRKLKNLNFSISLLTLSPIEGTRRVLMGLIIFFIKTFPLQVFLL